MKLLLLPIFLFILISCLFINCTPKLPDNSSDQNEVNNMDKIMSVKYGEMIELSKDLKVSFVDVQDSRCPKEVNCMVAGKAKVQLNIEGKGFKETIELVAKGLCYEMDGSCGASAMTNDYKVQLFNVNPYPLKKTAPKERCIAVIQVSK